MKNNGERPISIAGSLRSVLALVAVAVPLMLSACRGRGPVGNHLASPALTTGPTAVATIAPTATGGDARFDKSGWKTDFSLHSVPLREISSGGPPRDGIPPLDRPAFVSVVEADSFLKATEPVVALEYNGEARSYPIQILIWHEIVNDTVGGLPVSVTFCPLCNTALAFDRTMDGRVLDFGTTGNLRASDLVMWDRQTESWWQQFTGTAIVGQLTGKQLEILPAEIVSWQDFKDAYPQGTVLSRQTGFDRPYGANPYAGYDNAHEPPFLFSGKLDGRMLPKERVVSVTAGGEAAVYPFRMLQKERVINDTVGDRPIVVFWQKGTLSPLDQASIALSEDVGSATVYAADADGRHLTFKTQRDTFVDAETGSSWTVLGRAIEGPLKGRQLAPVVHANPFWFAAAAANQNVRIYGQ